MGKRLSKQKRRKKNNPNIDRRKAKPTATDSSFDETTANSRLVQRHTGPRTRGPYSEDDLQFIQAVDEVEISDLRLGGNSLTNIKATDDKLFIAAIDIGTTYSGYAYSSRQELNKDPTKIYCQKMQDEGGELYYKTSTAVLFKPDKTFYKFGSAAETYFYEEDKDFSDWYFFRHFKMLLYDKKDVLTKDTMLNDVTGSKEMQAVEVFSAAIKYFKEEFLALIKRTFVQKCLILEKDIHWVITVPAIWEMRAKQFMRDAANMAGILDDQLSLALEPEAASLYCRSVPMSIKEENDMKTVDVLSVGTSYIVLDQGGGTIDVTAHHIVSNDSLKEIIPANGGNWGGNYVNHQFELFLEEIFSQEVVRTVKTKHPGDYMDMLRAFERKKREFKSNSTTNVVLPLNYSFQNVLKEKEIEVSEEQGIKFGKLRIPAPKFVGFYKESILNITSHIASLLENPMLQDVKTILAVGGFSESAVLMDSIRESFPTMRIIVPNDSNLAVLKGAVLFGLRPNTIKSRLSRYTYGISVEKEISDESIEKYSTMRKDRNGRRHATAVFQKLVEIGEEVMVGEWQSPTQYDPVDENPLEVHIEFYATEDKNPVHVTDNGCVKLGTLEVDLRDRIRRDGGLSLRINAGGTEIEATLKDENTDKEFKAHFCIP